MKVGRRMSPVHGLIEVDVTKAVRRLEGTDVSFTAFVVATVARAAALHPEVHAYRDWLGRIVVHHYVDVATLIEVNLGRASFPLAHLIRDADVRDVVDITDEVLDLTVTFDHNTVDGAPAARFVADLRRLLTGADVLD